MEEDTPALRAWVRTQHEQAMARLSAVPAREEIRRRLLELIGAPATGPITQAGRRLFFRRRLPGQELSGLYCQDGPDGVARALVDPNELSPQDTTTIADIHPSPDGSLIAFRRSESGSSCMPLDVLDVESRQVLETIPGKVNPVAHAWHTRNRVAWLPDNRGFFYTRCPHDTPASQARFNHKLYFHQLGADWRDDPIVFGESLKREQSPYPLISVDGRYLAVLVQDLSGLAPRSELYLQDRERSPNAFIRLIGGMDVFIQAAFHRDRLYIRTNDEAPWGKLTAVQLPLVAERGAATVIAESSYPLRAWTTVGNYLFVETIEDVSSRLRVYDLDGNFVKEIGLPGLGSIEALSADPESNELRFSFSSFLTPPARYRIDLQTLVCEIHQPTEELFNPRAFVTEQVWFESPDQTRIPMFLIHRKGIEREGNNAAVIHGYGGFGVSLLPKFTPHVIPFLEHGGIYAVVNARGGGEFGADWHRQGARDLKQNVFADFIAAGEWLIAQGYTTPAKLGCFGWSNGGLSVNVVAVQRPELWGAVVAGAPVTDMGRFHLAHGGRHWIADYGSPEDPAELESLMRYSPYHTLPRQIEAPAILTIAPGNDDRVAPWHSYKMHAAWQAANVSNNPILLRGEEQAGHRGSPAASRAVDLYADIWSFFFAQLGVK